MAKKLSELTAATQSAVADLLLIEQGGVDKKITFANFMLPSDSATIASTAMPIAKMWTSALEVTQDANMIITTSGTGEVQIVSADEIDLTSAAVDINATNGITIDEDSGAHVGLTTAGQVDIDSASGQIVDITSDAGVDITLATTTDVDSVKIDTTGGVDIDVDEGFTIDDDSGAFFSIADTGYVQLSSGGAYNMHLVSGGEAKLQTTHATLRTLISATNSTNASAIWLSADAGGIKLSAATNKLITLDTSGTGEVQITAGAEIDLTATAIDINGAADISGNLTVHGNILPDSGDTSDIGTTTDLINDIFVKGAVKFRPVGTGDEAKIYRNLSGEDTELKFQIAAGAADKLIFENGDLTALVTISGTGDVQIPGDLTVSGTTTYVTSTNTSNSNSAFIIKAVETAATHTGSADMTSGHDWTTDSEQILLTTTAGGPTTLTLDADTANVATTVTEINDEIANNGVLDHSAQVEAFANGANVGIRSLINHATGFTLATGTPDALTILGMTAAGYTGADTADGDATFEVERATTGNSKLKWNDTTDAWDAVYGSDGGTTSPIVTEAYGNASGVDVDGFVQYVGTTQGAAGTFDGSSTAPDQTTRLNYNGEFHCTTLVEGTPYPSSTQVAYDAITMMERLPEGRYDASSKLKQLDHDSLHEYIKVGDDGRDASATISCLVEVVKDLVKQVAELKAKI